MKLTMMMIVMIMTTMTCLEIGDTAGVVLNGKVADVVIERVDGDVAPHCVLILGAEHVVGQQPAGRVHVVVGFAVFFAGVRCGAEGRDFDNVLPVTHVRQAKAPADQTRVAKQLPDLLRARVGDNVEILGLASQHEVAHATTHEKTRVASVLQAIQNF